MILSILSISYIESDYGTSSVCVFKIHWNFSVMLLIRYFSKKNDWWYFVYCYILIKMTDEDVGIEERFFLF